MHGAESAKVPPRRLTLQATVPTTATVCAAQSLVHFEELGERHRWLQPDAPGVVVIERRHAECHRQGTAAAAKDAETNTRLPPPQTTPAADPKPVGSITKASGQGRPG